MQRECGGKKVVLLIGKLPLTLAVLYEHEKQQSVFVPAHNRDGGRNHDRRTVMMSGKFFVFLLQRRFSFLDVLIASNSCITVIFMMKLIHTALHTVIHRTRIYLLEGTVKK